MTTRKITTTKLLITWTKEIKACRQKSRGHKRGASAHSGHTSPRPPRPARGLWARTPHCCITFPQAPGSTATTASPLSRGSIQHSDLTPCLSSFALTPPLVMATRTTPVGRRDLSIHVTGFRWCKAAFTDSQVSGSTLRVAKNDRKPSAFLLKYLSLIG